MTKNPNIKFAIIYFIAFAGVFAPTSVGGQVSLFLSAGSTLLCLFLIIVCFINAGLPIRRGLLSLLILVLMVIFTFASPFSSVAWGGFIPYVFILAILLTSFKADADEYDQSFDLLLIGILVLINIFIFVIGFGTVLNFQQVIDLQSSFYQSIGDELFEHMVIWYSKPVTVFGSHSTAAFMYLIFFVVNLKLIQVIGVNKKLKILIAFFCVQYFALNLFLISNSSYVVAILMMAAVLFSARSSVRIGLSLLILILAFMLGVNETVQIDFEIVRSDGNGLYARYSQGGRLQGTYNYLMESYFRPIGFTYDSSINLGDNFIAEYIVKISIVGYILLLFLLWSWLRLHLSLKDSIVVLMFILMTDLAYPMLVYDRFAKLLPFFVLLWIRLNSHTFILANKIFKK